MKLQFSKSFNTQHAPELFVEMASDVGGEKGDWKLVSTLTRSWGGQGYDLHGKAAGAGGAEVMIFCAMCDRVWGRARLQPVRTVGQT